MATALVALDAVDVAMTEAAVGAGISTVLLLSALYLVRGDEAEAAFPALAAARARSIVMAGTLVYGTFGLPAFSDPAAPIHSHVVPRYVNDAVRETGVPNVVTAVLASYRGYDTLGETTVVFTAGAGVIALLRRRRRHRSERGPAMRQYLVLRVVAKIMIPFMLLFALYVQFHGDYGPGGGFQAGVIIAAAIIFYAIVFGLADRAQGRARLAGRDLPRRRRADLRGRRLARHRPGRQLSSTTSCSTTTPSTASTAGSSGSRSGVCVTVAGVMLKIFYMFAAAAGKRRRVSFFSHFSYWITMFLLVAGLYIVIARGNLVKKLIGLSIFQTSVVPALHRARQADRRHGADRQRQVHRVLQSAAACPDPHGDRRGHRDARARTGVGRAHPRGLRHASRRTKSSTSTRPRRRKTTAT